MKKILKVLSVLIVALSLVACSNNVPTDSSEKVLTIGYDRDAEVLDTIKTAWYSDALIYIHDRLVTRDYDFSYQPGLAKSWETSDDGITWRFVLRDDVTFHDGSEFTSEDVKWTLDTILDPETGSPFMGDLASIKSVEIIDDYTIDIILNYPFPNLLFNLSTTASGIHPANAYETYGDDYGKRVIIGSGPYKFEEWVSGDRTVLVRNEDYAWGPDWMENQGPALIDKIIMKVLPEENSRIMELEVGGIQILRNVPEIYVDQLNKNDEVSIYQEPATKLGYLAYATDKEPFNDIKVRQALNHAINKEDVIQFVFTGMGEVAHGYLPPALSDEYLQESVDLAYDFNPQKAKDLLTEAGYPDGLTLSLSADNSSKMSKLAEIVQVQLKEVGIETEIRLYDSSSYADFLRQGEQELFINEYSWPNADIIDWFLLSERIPYPNHSKWNDPTTDEMIMDAAQSSSWEERAQGYKEVQEYLIEQAVWVPIYIPMNTIAARAEVTNFKYHPWMLQYNDGFDIDIE